MNENKVEFYDVICALKAGRDVPYWTEQVMEDLVKLVCSGCHAKTYDRVRANLRWTSTLKLHGIYRRVEIHFKDDGSYWYVGYCTGQSFTDEIRVVREFLKEG